MAIEKRTKLKRPSDPVLIGGAKWVRVRMVRENRKWVSVVEAGDLRDGKFRPCERCCVEVLLDPDVPATLC